MRGLRLFGCHPVPQELHNLLNREWLRALVLIPHPVRDLPQEQRQGPILGLALGGIGFAEQLPLAKGEPPELGLAQAEANALKGPEGAPVDPSKGSAWSAASCAARSSGVGRGADTYHASITLLT